MYAVVVNVTIKDVSAAQDELKELVPRVSGAPGFVAAYWVALPQGKGTSVALFDSEASAQAQAAGVTPLPDSPVSIDSIEVGEVIAHAQPAHTARAACWAFAAAWDAGMSVWVTANRDIAEARAAAEAIAEWRGQMSQENVEIVRQLANAFSSDSAGTGWLEFYDPGAELHMADNWPEDTVYKGHSGIQRAADLMNESFDSYRWDVERLIDAGSCVAGQFQMRGWIKAGGGLVEQHAYAVACFAEEKIVRLLIFTSWSEALKAVGLEE